MRFSEILKDGLSRAAMLAGMISEPAPAAVTLNDDVQCLLLSTGYARVAKDENSQRVATMTGAFFLGRLSSRLSDPALSAAIRRLGMGLPGKEAEPLMRACAARASVAEQATATVVRDAQNGH